jgi:hypothetical protein
MPVSETSIPFLAARSRAAARNFDRILGGIIPYRMAYLYILYLCLLWVCRVVEALLSCTCRRVSGRHLGIVRGAEKRFKIIKHIIDQCSVAILLTWALTGSGPPSFTSSCPSDPPAAPFLHTPGTPGSALYREGPRVFKA